MTEMLSTTRRGFLKGAAAGGTGLAIAVHLPVKAAKGAVAAAPFEPNAFVRIGTDNSVTVIAKHIEFGQGSHSGLGTILAEELDAAWDQISIEAAPADAERYNNLLWGPYQGTGGSSAIPNSWMQLREAGAKARAMLVSAASKKWGVPAGEITVDGGVVSHGANSATFGELANLAAAEAVPESVSLKDPSQFKLIGRMDTQRKDIPGKTNGTAVFTQDVQRPGMLYAAVARPIRFGAKVASFDATAAKQVNGVVEVVQIPRGIAVVAKNTYAAFTGRDALEIEWDFSEAENRSSDEMMAEYRGFADKEGLPARNDGDVDAAFAAADKVIERDYEFPFLAHAPMEPLNAVAEMDNGRLHVWTGSQLQTLDHYVASQVAGIEPQNVEIHTMITGGSFGRRATPDADQVQEVVAIARSIGWSAPVKLVWSREDDVKGGRYRPMYFHRLTAGLDAEGNITAWRHRIIGGSIVKGGPFEGLIQNGIDGTSVEGASNLPYAVPNLKVELHTVDSKVPLLWWRAVGSTHTAYSTELFLDEIARDTGADPAALRGKLLADHPRHKGVLDAVVKMSGWGEKAPEGRFRGLAVHESFNSFVAQVAEVSLDGPNGYKVEKVWCAVDCGIAINPNVIKAQMEGGIGFGLGAVMRDEITLTNGEVDQNNFDDYEPIRITDMPDIEVDVVVSGEAPTGVGEPGTPVVGPAVASALQQATGKWIRALPFTKADVVS